MPLEIRVPHPASTQLYQRVPISRKGQFEDETDYAVIVVLNLALEALPRFEHQRLQGFDYRGPLVTNVGWGGILEAGFESACTEYFSKLIQADLFADVELHENQQRTVQ